MTGQDHNKLLSIFFMIQGGLQLVGGLIAGLIYAGMGTFMATSMREEEAAFAGGFMLVIGVLVVLLSLAFGGFYFLTGWKMHKLNPSARVFGIIASIICLLGFPLGTALGIYGLWFLFGDEGRAFYSGGSYSEAPPPPPNSWQ